MDAGCSGKVLAASDGANEEVSAEAIEEPLLVLSDVHLSCRSTVRCATSLFRFRRLTPEAEVGRQPSHLRERTSGPVNSDRKEPLRRAPGRSEDGEVLGSRGGGGGVGGGEGVDGRGGEGGGRRAPGAGRLSPSVVHANGANTAPSPQSDTAVAVKPAMASAVGGSLELRAGGERNSGCESAAGAGAEVVEDNDGDLLVPRRKRRRCESRSYLRRGRTCPVRCDSSGGEGRGEVEGVTAAPARSVAALACNAAATECSAAAPACSAPLQACRAAAAAAPACRSAAAAARVEADVAAFSESVTSDEVEEVEGSGEYEEGIGEGGYYGKEESGIDGEEDGDVEGTKETELSGSSELSLDDEDADAPLSVVVQHRMKTCISDVGLQVWSGAVLASEFLLANPALVAGRVVMELGAGTGLLGIVAATLACSTYITDIGGEVLRNCERNVSLNSRLVGRSKVVVRSLDWRKGWPPPLPPPSPPPPPPLLVDHSCRSTSLRVKASLALLQRDEGEPETREIGSGETETGEAETGDLRLVPRGSSVHVASVQSNVTQLQPPHRSGMKADLELPAGARQCVAALASVGSTTRSSSNSRSSAAELAGESALMLRSVNLPQRRGEGGAASAAEGARSEGESQPLEAFAKGSERQSQGEHEGAALPNSFVWSREEVAEAEGVDLIVAADVVYSDDLTDAFFAMLARLTTAGGRPKVTVVSVERRYNFSVDFMQVVAHGYQRFRSHFVDVTHKLPNLSDPLQVVNGLMRLQQEREREVAEHLQLGPLPEAVREVGSSRGRQGGHPRQHTEVGSRMNDDDQGENKERPAKLSKQQVNLLQGCNPGPADDQKASHFLVEWLREQKQQQQQQHQGVENRKQCSHFQWQHAPWREQAQTQEGRGVLQNRANGQPTSAKSHGALQKPQPRPAVKPNSAVGFGAACTDRHQAVVFNGAQIAIGSIPQLSLNPTSHRKLPLELWLIVSSPCTGKGQ